MTVIGPVLQEVVHSYSGDYDLEQRIQVFKGADTFKVLRL
jgi:hypothetical protein